MKYNLAHNSWDNEEEKAILSVVNSDRYTMGPKVKQFELDCAKYFGSKYAVMVNSGSSANLLSVAGLRYHSKLSLKPGDEVIVPAVSWSTTYFPLYQYNLKLRFVDISLDTLNIDLDKVEKAITPNTKAIYAVNLLGNPNNFNKLKALCDAHDLILLEDNCESMGATYDGKFTGTFGICGSMSTFFSHHLSTIEGGIILTNDEEMYYILLSLRAHGWTRDIPKDSPIYSKTDNFYELFRFILPGYNVRPNEMFGALGVVQLKKLDKILEQRRINAKIFNKLFADSDKFFIQKECGNSSWFGFSIILKPQFVGKRKALVKFLEENGIETRPIVAGNFINNPAIKYMDYSIYDGLNNAAYLDRNGFFIGNNHFNLINELYHFNEVINSFSW